MAPRQPWWAALLLPFLLAGVVPSAAASLPTDACRVPTIGESVIGTPEMCSTLDRLLGDPVGVIEVSHMQRFDKIIKIIDAYANLFVPLPC